MPYKRIFKPRNKFLRYILLIVSLGFLVAISFYLHRVEPDLKKSDLIKILTGGLVVIGLMYSIMSYESVQAKNQYDMHRQQLASSFEIINQWYKTPLIDYSSALGAFQQTSEFSLITTDVVAFYNIINNDQKECRTALAGIFNYFEIICCALKEDLLEEEFIKRYFQGIFYRMYDLYHPYILYRRIDRGVPDIWNDYTETVEYWREDKPIR